MPIFDYEAARNNGASETGSVVAVSESAAVAQLRARGLTPLSLEAATGRPSRTSAWRSLAANLTWRGGRDDQVALLRDLAALLSAGIKAQHALPLLKKMTSRRMIVQTLTQWESDLRSGKSLSAAMANTPGIVSPSVAHAIASSELSGNLAETAARIAQSLEAAQILRNKLVSALAYPLLLTITMFGVLGFLFTTVIPNLKPLFLQAGAEMPWPTAILVGLADLAEGYGLILASLFILIFVGCAAFAYSENGKALLDRFYWKSRLLAGIPAKAAVARFAHELSMLLSGGVTLSRAMEFAVAAVRNSHFRNYLRIANDRIRQGQSLKSALGAIEGVPPLLVELAGVGDETGKHADSLLRAADFLDKDVELVLDRITAMILPVMTLVLGFVVAMIMLGVVTGILAANELVD